MNDYVLGIMATFFAAVAVPTLLIVLGSVFTPKSTKPDPALVTKASALASSKTRRRRVVRVTWLHAKRSTAKCLVWSASCAARVARQLTPRWVVSAVRQIVRWVHPQSLVISPRAPVALPLPHVPRIASSHVVCDKRVRSKPVVISKYPDGTSVGRLKIGSRPSRYLSLGELPTSPTVEDEFVERAKQKLAEVSGTSRSPS